MGSAEKIKRHGFLLTWIAVIGMFCIGVLGLLLVMAPYTTSPFVLITDLGWKFDWTAIARMDATGKGLVSSIALLWAAAWLAPMIGLHHLGGRLHRFEALSPPVADAFRNLAHSLVTSYLLQGVGGFMTGIAEVAGGVQFNHPTWNVSIDYIFLVACLCLYSMAHLMKLAAEAADDARSIV